MILQALKARAFFALLVLTIATVAAQAEPTVEPKTPAQQGHQAGSFLYQVLPGEYLTEILRSMGFANLWGKNGMVERTINANPEVKKNPDKLEPWTTIQIFSSTVPNIRDYEITDGQIRKRSQVLELVCPDHSVHQVHAQMVPAKGKGKPSQVILLGDANVCAASSPQPAAPIVGATPEAAPLSAPIPEVTETKPEPNPPPQSAPAKAASSEHPIMPIRTGPANGETRIDDSLPKTFDPAVFADDVLYKKHPFSIAILGGYSNDTFQLGAGGNPILNGPSYGLRLEAHFHHGDWGALVGMSYRQAVFNDTGPGLDYVVLNMLEPSLGMSWKSWILRAGLAFNQATDANVSWNGSFGDNGWFASIARRFYITDRFSAELEGRYTNVIYTTGDNSSLSTNNNSTQLEALVTFGLHL